MSVHKSTHSSSQELPSLEDVAKKLQKHGFGVSLVPTLAQAADHVLTDLLPASGAKSVSFGGSATVVVSGLVEKLKAVPGLDVLDTYDRSIPADAFMERRRQALLTDLFLCSANAVSADGRIFLLDMFGNRTAAVQFGPKKVILLVGKNKLAADTHAAIHRVRNVAAPANVKRFNKKTPCAEVGYCMNCSSPDRICAVWTIVDRCVPKERIHVVLFDEDAGF